MTGGADRPRPHEMLARLEQMEQSAEQMLSKLEALQGELCAEAVEVHSEDGFIRVKLDSDGLVDEVEIHEYAMRFRNALGEHIRQTVMHAKQVHADRAAEMAKRLLGETLDVQAILNQYRT
ncbi:YbaB/EbfC family nucleoid-associated protein [Glycomyces sp. NPDC049804]|uniref:YbaB/EbfC family nucleoid-associated protein n=1 Tax=Glycomyces sp. NPDC049804 TaxID=3154363 RepID=UPI0034344F9A